MIVLIIMSVLINWQSSERLLVPFPEIQGNYVNIEKDYIEIRKYDFILNIDTLIYKDEVIMQPDSGMFSLLYEMFKEKYIVIAPFPEDKWYVDVIYELPKHEIKIIALNDLDKIYEVNIEGKDLIDIDLEKGIVCVKDPETGESKEIEVTRIK